jgi:hypothetical protein
MKRNYFSNNLFWNDILQYLMNISIIILFIIRFLNNSLKTEKYLNNFIYKKV